MENFRIASLSVQEIGLGGLEDFVLYQVILVLNDKPYIKDVFVKYKEELIVKNYRETLEFFSLLDSFVKKWLSKGDELKFFKYVEKKESNFVRKSLQCKFDKKRYISTAEAKTMVQFYNESKVGYSFRNVLLRKTAFSSNVKLMQKENKLFLFSDEEFIDFVHGKLKNEGIKYDDTTFVSEKIIKLLDRIKKRKPKGTSYER